MKYALLGATLAAIIIAALALSNSGERVPRAVSPIGAAPVVTVPIVPQAVTVPVLPPATRIPELIEPLTRLEVINLARQHAVGMAESDPVLIDAVLTTADDASERTSRPGQPEEGLLLIDNPTPVWLVRMRGSFLPDRGLSRAGLEATPVPDHGWMYLIVESQTSQVLSYGYRQGDAPLR